MPIPPRIAPSARFRRRRLGHVAVWFCAVLAPGCGGGVHAARTPAEERLATGNYLVATYKNAEAFACRAEAHLEAGLLDAAFADANQACAMSDPVLAECRRTRTAFPDARTGYSARAKVYEARGEYSKAAADLETQVVIQRLGGNTDYQWVDTHVQLAEDYLKAGMLIDAERKAGDIIAISAGQDIFVKGMDLLAKAYAAR
ncbi:MAG: hypothetical protein H0W72_06620 [Planctomycetes bacterium]|nr:hypothetical protein [Planctomycetota bacterium]